jgi:hypothetical protein
MEKALEPLHGRTKRQAYENFDEGISNFNSQLNIGQSYDEEQDDEASSDVANTLQSIKIPLTNKGNPAFSIHASTVYILYPSLFQDPNIFGRFAIPQSINLDSKTTQKEQAQQEQHQQQKDEYIPQQQQQFNQNQYQQQQAYQSQPSYYQNMGGRRNAVPMRRSALQNDEEQQNDENKDDDNGAKDDESKSKEKKITNTLSGSITVLNQDVNEINSKGGY